MPAPFGSAHVWIRAPHDSPEPYVLATVTSTDGNAIYSVHVDGVERHVVLEQDAWLANEDGANSPDASQLAHLNPPAVLHWLRLRAEHGHSFSTVAERLLLYLAPLKPNPRLYSVAEMQRAAAAGTEGAEPHVYALVEQAWRAAMRRDTTLGGARTHAIVLQGDAGSGQAELGRQAVEYWVWRAAPALAHEAAAARGLALRSRLRQCELVLQAVGHARSGGSRDACRFSKVWRVEAAPRRAEAAAAGGEAGGGGGGEAGGGGSLRRVALHAFGLEAGRVLRAAGEEEGNYHCYYLVLHKLAMDNQLANQTDGPLQQQPGGAAARGAAPRGGAVRGAAPRDFAMLRSSSGISEGPGRSAAACEALGAALGTEGLGWTPRECSAFWRVLAGLLRLSEAETDPAAAAAAAEASMRGVVASEQALPLPLPLPLLPSLTLTPSPTPSLSLTPTPTPTPTLLASEQAQARASSLSAAAELLGVPALPALLAEVGGDGQAGGGAEAAASSAPEGGAYEADLATLTLTPTRPG